MIDMLRLFAKFKKPPFEKSVLRDGPFWTIRKLMGAGEFKRCTTFFVHVRWKYIYFFTQRLEYS